MMNRYTLQFKETELEEKYQEFQLEHKRKPLAKAIILLTFVLVIVKGLFSIIEANMSELYQTLGYFAAAICFLIIYFCKPSYIRWTLVVSTYLIAIPYMRVEEGKNQYHYQLASALVVAFQFVVITTGEFIDALIQVTSIFFLYLGYYINYQKNYSYAFVASVFMIVFLLIITFYKNAAAERSKFQLTLIDNQWDQILFSTITQPSIIFSFDFFKNSFVLKRSLKFVYPCESTDELKLFLRNSKLVKNRTISLENYIYTDIHHLKKSLDDTNNQKLLVEYEKKIQEFSISIFLGASPIILLKIVESSFQMQNIHIDRNYQFKYLSLLKSLYIQVKYIFKLKTINFKRIFKIVIYHNLLERLNRGLPHKYNLRKVIIRAKQLYQEKKIIIVNQQFSSSIVIGHKEAVLLMLMEILETIISHQVQIRIENFVNENAIEIQVEGEFHDKQLERFNQRSKYLFKYFKTIKAQQQQISFSIKNEAFSEFHKQPPTSKK